MAIIPFPPPDIRSSKILALIKERSFSEVGVYEKVDQFIEAASPLLDLIISGPFREFTLHNKDHAKKLLHLVEYVISVDTLANLSTVELLVIVYMAHLHDLGLCLTSTERNRIIAMQAFSDTIRDWPELWNSLEDARRRLEMAKKSGNEQESLLIESEIFQLQEVGLMAYLRPRHATEERYKEFISLLKRETGRNDLFEFQGVSFEDVLIQICISHNQDVGVLAEVRGTYAERFPRDHNVGRQKINTQFCAAVLRLVDVLDFDRERTPKILFESLGIAGRSLPGADVTVKEWQKHMAVHSIEMNSHEIVVTADSKHPVIEKSIIEFCGYIEREIRDTLAVIRRNPPEIISKYNIEIPVTVRPSIRPTGYVYRDMSLRLNETAVMSLLMGERLYSRPEVALRELIQNSIDACIARQTLEDHHSYKPEINISLTKDEQARHWIHVVDNGIGMDEYILGEYFLQLGNSYYDSSEFLKSLKQATEARGGFTPISRFGIGIVSVFMIADIIEVFTKRFNSPRGDAPPRRVRIERMGGLAFITELASGDYGSKVSIRIKREFEENYGLFISELFRFMTHTILRPRVNINIELGPHKRTLRWDNFAALRSSASRYLAERDIEAIVLDTTRWSDRISGPIMLFFRNNAGKLENSTGSTRQKFGNGKDQIPLSEVVQNYNGNTLTINGFRMSLAKASRLFGSTSNKFLTALYDLDIHGDKEVVYDVSRDRLVGTGRPVVFNSIREAMRIGLIETGTMDRLTDETAEKIRSGLMNQSSAQLTTYHTSRPTAPYTYTSLTDELLERIAKLLPERPRPPDVHKSIAKELNISHSLAQRAISRLLRGDNDRNFGSTVNA